MSTITRTMLAAKAMGMMAAMMMRLRALLVCSMR
jgi:hypothetical protein